MSAISRYASNLIDELGQGWNRFWFAPQSSAALDYLRIGTGVVGLLWWLSFLPTLTTWFGEEGLLPLRTLRRLVGGESEIVYRFSWFYAGDSSWIVISLYLVGLLAFVAHTLGLGGRISTLIAWSFTISVVHRMPMMAGLLEPVLTMSLLYLAIGPATRHISLDRRLFGKSNSSSTSIPGSSLGTISLRLIQLHMLFFYVVMASTQLRHTTWWQGEAMWTMLASSETRVVDLTFLGKSPFVLNAATQAIVVFEVLFPIFIWKNSLRPLLLGLSVLFWLVVGVASGQLLYAILMSVLGLAFLPASTSRTGGPKAFKDVSESSPTTTET